MKDKEKQIEEKIMEIAECNKESCQDCKITCTYYYAIKRFCELYLPEDSVVLSREEYEKLKSLYDSQQGAIMTSSIGDLPLTVEGLRKAVDEIARLIGVQTELQELNAKYYNEAKDLRREVNRLKAHAKINDEHLHIRIKNQSSKETAEKIFRDICELNDNTRSDIMYIDIEELAKKYGVEIKE